MSDTPNIGFVRHEPIPPSPPPVQQAGVVKWMRENSVLELDQFDPDHPVHLFRCQNYSRVNALDVERGLDHQQPAGMPGSLARHQWRVLVGFGGTLEPNVVWLPISGRSLLAPDLGLCVAFGQHRSGIVPEITAQNADLFGDLSLCGVLADLGRNASDPCRGRPIPHRGLFGFRENRAPHWVCNWALVRRCRRGHRALLGQLCDRSAA